MSEVFLETSAVADCFFKAKKERETAFRVIPHGDTIMTSHYVIFELCRGYLRYLILLHNKTTLFTTFSDLCRYGHAVRLRAYFQGAIWESFTKFFSEAQLQSPNQIAEDEYKLICFRSFLRKDIRRCWKKMMRGVGRIVNDVGCRDNISDPTIGTDGQYEQVLDKQLCGIARCCGLKSYAARHANDFTRLRDRLQAQSSPDDETARRTKALRELYRNPTRDFAKTDCYVCGDAIIAHEAPADAPIVTKNKKHLVPICEVFGKQLLSVEYQSLGA